MSVSMSPFFRVKFRLSTCKTVRVVYMHFRPFIKPGTGWLKNEKSTANLYENKNVC